ncbi:AAA family ATPase [Corallococcus sp. M34]|nr:AAA family ATPase [Citreicoccus inhibens]
MNGFRNLGAFSLELAPGLNVLLGENNIGKTNLMDAIRAALGAASTANGEPVRLRPDDLAASADGQLDGVIRIDLTYSGLSDEEKAEFIELLDYDAAKPDASVASIHFEWRWSAAQQRWHSRRWAGNRPDAEAAVPEEVLQSLPVTFLEALRNALSALVPGRNSRLGRLLVLQSPPGDSERQVVEKIVQDANMRLEQSTLILRAQSRIQDVLRMASGSVLGQEIAIRTAEPNFERIARGLRLLFAERHGGTSGGMSALADLDRNGLGYNNLLYVGTVLAELENLTNAALSLLLVEEPEAHLHPQLQTLLADCLVGGASMGAESRIQTIVTTHSPTIAAHVSPAAITVMHRDEHGRPYAAGLRNCGLNTEEFSKLRRMLDVTRASMLFARGVILVEGISEALLLPVLARRLGMDLAACGVSIVPVHGVDFRILGKLFGPGKLQLPLSIVTDGDPPIEGANSPSAHPRREPNGSLIVEGDRVASLRDSFSGHQTARVFISRVTFEFNLASEALENASVMVDAWLEYYHQKKKSPLQPELVANLAAPEERALVLWRALCHFRGGPGKAEFAHLLAARLEDLNRPFVVPKYLCDAFEHACRRGK